MNFLTIFIYRPIATTLLTLAILLSGLIAYELLPVAPLPQVDFPMIMVQASLPGASPETMATTVATPLERSLGRIAGIDDMTSTSSLGSTRIMIQFDINRDINGAARDVQAAINEARSLLPSGMPSNPTYRKANPADAPIMAITLTSDTAKRSELYDIAATILAQKFSQIDGVGQVNLGGSSLPAVRVELNPYALNKYGIGLETVRSAIAAANPNRPKGFLETDDNHWQVDANDQASHAIDYLPMVITYKNGAAVKLSDVGRVVDSVQDIRNAGSSNGKPAVIMLIIKQPGANIIDTVERIKATLPQLHKSIPQSVHLNVLMERTSTIKASLHDVEITLLISILLVILVVFVFLRSAPAVMIPSVVMPVSLVGTFGFMYLLDYSLDNFSLMALTIATGFVVDDAIVVLENISRHIEKGLSPLQASIIGVREVGFTVVSMSISLVAVFIPILLMGGIIGRLFHEFAVTLSIAILFSLIVSLTTTPMMCSRLLKAHQLGSHGRLYLWVEDIFNTILGYYSTSLSWCLKHQRTVLLILLGTIILNVYLYIIVPKGFFPIQDTGRIRGTIQADQSISFQAMKHKLDTFVDIVRKDPAVENVFGFTGGGGPSSAVNTGTIFLALKPLTERDVSSEEVIARLRGKLSKEPGAKLFLQSAQDIQSGGRSNNALFQYSLQSESLDDLRKWTPTLIKAMKESALMTDVSTDQEDKGSQTSIVYDRNTMARLGITPSLVNSTLNDAYGQRQVSVIYNPLNQYHVVMEVDPQYSQSTEALKNTYVTSSSGAEIPLSVFARYEPTSTPLSINHQSQFASSNISFNLPIGTSLGDASSAIETIFKNLNVPDSVRGSFQGTAKIFQQSTNNQPFLILAAFLTIYIVLGILYESYIHPLTILSTLPSAGVGAILALMLFQKNFDIIALIGVILLIGIVKKNAIMMIDFAVNLERRENVSPEEAIYRACVIRFRPIMMTTMAALFGALPLALGHGNGAEIRQPLGISVVGGLMISQILTLYTTPVVYIKLDKFRHWFNRKLYGVSTLKSDYLTQEIL